MRTKITLLSLLVLAIVTTNCSQKQKTEKSMETKMKHDDKKLYTTIEKYVLDREKEFQSISEERKETLRILSNYISEKKTDTAPINLTFICTHNSRRSHMSQLWAQVATFYYKVENIQCYSGGTEATEFNKRSVKALRKAGFKIDKTNESENPLYHVSFVEGMEPIHAFSKKYEHELNPQTGFAAIMTCSDADEACPIVFGANERISITYEDPKVADDTPQEEAKYDERSMQIAREMLYVFSQVKS